VFARRRGRLDAPVRSAAGLSAEAGPVRSRRQGRPTPRTRIYETARSGIPERAMRAGKGRADHFAKREQRFWMRCPRVNGGETNVPFVCGTGSSQLVGCARLETGAAVPAAARRPRRRRGIGADASRGGWRRAASVPDRRLVANDRAALTLAGVAAVVARISRALRRRARPEPDGRWSSATRHSGRTGLGGASKARRPLWQSSSWKASDCAGTVRRSAERVGQGALLD
jgi:hypothetical protein